MEGKCDNKEGAIDWDQPLPRILGYKRGSEIKEGDTTKVRVYQQYTLIDLPLAGGN